MFSKDFHRKGCSLLRAHGASSSGKLENVDLYFFRIPDGIDVPGGFKQLREVCRINFHLSWYLSDSVVSSYDHFNEKVNDEESNDY